MHYLLYGHGLQTWEYSPAFALRSYAYLLPYKWIAQLALLCLRAARSVYPPAALLPDKIFAFYAVRVALALACAAAETYFHAAVRRRFGRDVARFLLLFLATSPGIFRASVEFLPSSFAMVMLTVAAAAWMNARQGLAICSVALASLLGWVYVAAMAVPIALDILLSERGVLTFAKYASASGACILIAMGVVDSSYYGKPVLTPLNHLLYNVFPKEGAGSHIFGVESAMFYIINLFLNCNIAALLLASFPVLCVVQSVSGRLRFKQGKEYWERLRFLSPPYLWLAILGNQPHKEERFLAPCYTFIALVASVAFVDWIYVFLQIVPHEGGTTPNVALHKKTDETFHDVSRAQMNVSSVAAIVKRSLTFVFTCAVTALGASRIAMQITAFQAPLRLYGHLSRNELRGGSGPLNAPFEFASPQQEVSICIGKEWYRFPTSFFLPDKRFRVRFIRAGFTGLMPKPFREHRGGTRVIPQGMNEFNQEDPSQFYSWQTSTGCHYFVDLNLSHRNSMADNGGGTDVPIERESQVLIFSQSFLDSERSSAGYRAFYIPGLEGKLVYGKYELLRNLALLPHGR